MNRATVVVVACAILAVAVLPLSAADKAKAPRSWSGIINDEGLRKMAPNQESGARGYVTDAKAWAKLWKAWRGDETVPKVDFAKELVVVATVDGPNRPFPVRLPLVADDNGDLSFLVGTTKVAGRGFGYYMAVGPRKDAKPTSRRPITRK
jgi:hypothetical protein